jgi:hypothetical protein
VTPISQAGFPDTKAIVSGEPQEDDSLRSRDDVGSGAKGKKSGKGFWLEGEEAKVAKDIDQKWSAQDKGMGNRLARWEVAAKRRDGDPYSKLVKDTDQDTFKVYTPRGIENAPPSLNKTDDLCIKVVANLLVDPPKPECEPASDNDDDRSSAEFSTRVLMNESTESGFNIPDHVRVAEDLACSYSSGFVYAYLDPQGGGHQPREIMAPQAATEVGPDGQPILEAPVGDGMAMMPEGSAVPQPIMGPPVLRYVGLDGKTIVDDPNEAMLEWLPKVCGEDITGQHVRFIPETCTGIRDADAALIVSMPSLDRLKSMFPETVGKMDAEDLRRLVSYRPKICDQILPKYAGKGQGTPSEEAKQGDGPPGDALCCIITAYHVGNGNYPLGAYVVMGGGKFILHRQEWKEKVRAKNGKLVDRAAIIPVSQFRQFRDVKSKDPYGRGLVDLLTSGDPLRSFAIGAVIEYLHRINNPHLFVPVGSGIQAKSLNLPRGTPIPYNAAGGGLPKQEEIPPLPSAFMDFYNQIGTEMDSRSGLEQAAQGVASPSVNSGTHAQQIVEQALVALSGMKQDMESGYMRLCRVILQLIRMGYTKPQRLKITGDDGSFKEREWTGTDLGNTTDIKIQVGSSTMLTPSAKSSIALQKYQLQAISLEDYQRSEEGNTRTLIGLQDNPAKNRIRGQNADWCDGPPENWQPPMAPVDPMTGQPPIDPATGQPAPTPVDPANPYADRRAVDQQQDIALLRFSEMARVQSGTKYATKAPEWRAYFDAEFEATRQAAGKITLVEQQQAMQQQQQQQVDGQQQIEAQKQQQVQADAETQRKQKSEDDAASHQRALEADDRKTQSTLQVEERKHQMAMEQKQADAQLAQSQPVAQPQAPSVQPGQLGPTPTVIVPPPDMTPVAEAVAQIGQMLQQVLAVEHPAPVVHVQAPKAPVVHVEAPVVHVPEQKAPVVHVNAPETKKRKRKGTITGPDGKKYTVQSEDE